MDGIRAWVIEHLSALFDFGKASNSSSGANDSVELEVEVDVDEDGETEGFENAEVWDSPAVRWRPSDPDASGHCEVLVMRAGDEIIITAGKDRRWQGSLAKGEVVVRGLASGSSLIRFKADGTIQLGDGATKEVARKGDAVKKGTSMGTWITAVTSFINGAGGSIAAPTDFGEINAGSAKIKAVD